MQSDSMLARRPILTIMLGVLSASAVIAGVLIVVVAVDSARDARLARLAEERDREERSREIDAMLEESDGRLDAIEESMR